MLTDPILTHPLYSLFIICYGFLILNVLYGFCRNNEDSKSTEYTHPLSGRPELAYHAGLL